jgi:DNA repair protein RecO (recombination protein O)
MVSPWHTGRIWLYGQKSGGAEKITDFDVERYRHTFRESFPKAQAASLVSELVIKTKAAGGAPRCWVLVNAFLDGLDRAAEEETGAALARFLWRYLDALGLQPPLDACVACGRPFGAGDSLVYAAGENGFLCPECAPSAGGGPSLSGEGAAYLRALSSLGAKEARNIPLSAGEEGRLKGFLFFLIQAACGERFKTLETFVPD